MTRTPRNTDTGAKNSMHVHHDTIESEYGVGKIVGGIIMAFITLIAAVFAFAFATSAIIAHERESQTAQVVGKITSLNSSTVDPDVCSPDATYTISGTPYSTGDGTTVDYSTFQPCPFRTGSTTTVAYNPTNPTNATIVDPAEDLGLSADAFWALFGLSAVVTVGLAGASVHMVRKNSRWAHNTCETEPSH